MCVDSYLINSKSFRHHGSVRHCESGPLRGAYAVRDGQLITGQNPASSGLVAQHLVAALQGT